MHSSSGVEVYLVGRKWTIAKLLACPLHPFGGATLLAMESHARAKPSRVRVVRWCPLGHLTSCLLPHFPAERQPRRLAQIEETTFSVARSPSVETASMQDLGVPLQETVRRLR